MRTIHRYPLQVGLNKLTVPRAEGHSRHSQVLAFDAKDEAPQVWLLVDDDLLTSPLYIYVALTGEDLTSAARKHQLVFSHHIGTALFHDGMPTIVLHAFFILPVPS